MVYYSMMGDVLRTVIFTALFVVACIVTVVVIWNVKADFYEDAMFATERVAAKLENAQKAQKGGTVTRNKDRSAKIERDGFHYGNGAGVFFYKAVYNRLRFATLKIFSKTFIINLLIAVGGSWLAGKIKNPLLDPLLIPVAAIALFAFYRTMGNPLDEDTSREFFILIPDAPLKKIWASLLGAVTNDSRSCNHKVKSVNGNRMVYIHPFDFTFRNHSRCFCKHFNSGRSCAVCKDDGSDNIRLLRSYAFDGICHCRTYT